MSDSTVEGVVKGVAALGAVAVAGYVAWRLLNPAPASQVPASQTPNFGMASLAPAYWLLPPTTQQTLVELQSGTAGLVDIGSMILYPLNPPLSIIGKWIDGLWR